VNYSQMKHPEVRFDVELISAAALAQYMTHRGETVRSLATKVGCKPATIGHLRSGHRRTARPEWARAIERHLDAPRGSLFVARVSSVQRDSGRVMA
jgi:hypothetical protein